MKIAVTAQGKDKQSAVDSRFGRAGYFVVHTTESGAWSVEDNIQNLNAAQGAGIQSAAHIINNGCEVLITGHCGPRAFAVLEKAGVAVYQTNAATVESAVTQYLEGGCVSLQVADVEGHW